MGCVESKEPLPEGMSMDNKCMQMRPSLLMKSDEEEIAQFEEESYESEQDKESDDQIEEVPEPAIFTMNFAELNTGSASLSTYPRG